VHGFCIPFTASGIGGVADHNEQPITPSVTKFEPWNLSKEGETMKINENPEILGDYTAKGNAAPRPTGSEFSAVLEETLGNTSGANTVEQQGSKIEGLSKAQFDFFSNKEDTAIDQVENYLNLLDAYQEKLGNPDVTLKEISPLLDQIKEEQGRLSAALDSLPEGDGLKDILNETLIISSLETIKFNRGDYN
jgi:hypothetical protein